MLHDDRGLAYFLGVDLVVLAVLLLGWLVLGLAMGLVLLLLLLRRLLPLSTHLLNIHVVLGKVALLLLRHHDARAHWAVLSGAWVSRSILGHH